MKPAPLVARLWGPQMGCARQAPPFSMALGLEHDLSLAKCRFAGFFSKTPSLTFPDENI